MESKTPLTDALEAGIKVRATRRGFNMPEDYQDAMAIARRLESALAVAEGALRELVVCRDLANARGYDAALEYGHRAPQAWDAARDALRAVEKLKGGM